MATRRKRSSPPAAEVRESLSDEVSLDDLGKGRPGITSAFGTCLMEAASVCLEDQHHTPGVRLVAGGDAEFSLLLSWTEGGAQRLRCWADPDLATEYGAYGIAFLLVERWWKLTVVERSYRKTGFDYWLGSENDSSCLFQERIRLEVSGLRRGTAAQIRARVVRKVAQVRRYSHPSEAVVVVVEFGVPSSEVVRC